MIINKVNNKYILEVFTWEINQEILLSSLNTDINNLVSIDQKKEIYENNIILTNKNWKKVIRNFIWSKKLTWLTFLKSIYDKLYNEISYSNKIEYDLFGDDNYNNFININLKNSYVLNVKKPGLDDFDDRKYKTSFSVINFLNEFSEFLEEWEYLKFTFSYKYTNTSNIYKNFIYNIKSVWMNEKKEEELFSSYTDKINYFMFDINISTNTKKRKVLVNMIKKSFNNYQNWFNKFNISTSRFTIPITFFDIYSKLQVDFLIWWWLFFLINNQYSKKWKKIITYNNNLIEKNLIL